MKIVSSRFRVRTQCYQVIVELPFLLRRVSVYTFRRQLSRVKYILYAVNIQIRFTASALIIVLIGSVREHVVFVHLTGPAGCSPWNGSSVTFESQYTRCPTAAVVIVGARNFDILYTCPTRRRRMVGMVVCRHGLWKPVWSACTKRRRKSSERSRRTIHVSGRDRHNTGGTYLADPRRRTRGGGVVGVLPITFEYVFRWKIYDYEYVRIARACTEAAVTWRGPLV